MILYTIACNHTYRNNNNTFITDKFVMQLSDIQSKQELWELTKNESNLRSHKLLLTCDFSYKIIKIEEVTELDISSCKFL